jgi:hypothetical protein
VQDREPAVVGLWVGNGIRRWWGFFLGGGKETRAQETDRAGWDCRSAMVR